MKVGAPLLFLALTGVQGAEQMEAGCNWHCWQHEVKMRHWAGKAVTDGSMGAQIKALEDKDFGAMIQALEDKHAAQIKALEDKLAHLSISQDAGSGACALKCKTGNLELLSSGAQ